MDTPILGRKLVFLGTGTSVGVPMIGCDCPTCVSTNPLNKRTRCSLVVELPEGNLLVDTTPDLRTQLLRERIGLIHAVVYTHGHADHLFGLDDLRVFPYQLKRHLELYCEEAVEQRIRKSFDYCFESAADGYYVGATPRLEIHRIDENPFRVLGAEVLPIRLWHGRGQVLGFRFGNVAYCTDTNAIPEESLARLAGLDVLILDCLRERPHPTHFGFDEAVAMAERIGARRTLFTHLSHGLEHEAASRALPPGMELAYDGLHVPLT